ncbi:MAG: dihydrolipoamide acetyltransferase family protein [Spirochaetia bacterium]
MAHNIIMPKTGMAMEEGTVVQWLKKVGDRISRGEVIAVIETDKVTMDLESDYEGTLLAIVHGDGEVVEATCTIAWIGEPGEQIRPPAEQAAPAAPADKVPATPAARAYAARSGIALPSVAGTGPGGAVRLKDLRLKDPQLNDPHSQDARAVPLTGMRRAIADKMQRSHQQVPSVTLVMRADVTGLESLRESMAAPGEERVSVTDFIIRAAATALRKHPLINSLVEGELTVVADTVNIGVAVALEDGLIVPVVRGADRLAVRQIAAARRDLVHRARAGRLDPSECAGGTFTITNLGMYGITEFTPLINIPESAILGVGAIEETLRAGPAGIEQRKVMSLCLTHDHRHIDGAPAAAFLGSIRSLLEDASSLVS